MELNELLKFAVQNKASDLHLSSLLPPMVRIDGTLRRIDKAPALEDAQILDFINNIMNERQRKEFEETNEADLSISLKDISRFRVNAFKQNRGFACVFRVIPNEIPTFEELKLPPIFKDISLLPRGLVLVTGPTGSGKSTTLAAMINLINTTKNDHILTIEDPIEFVHQSKNCLINQREVHRDTNSFHVALRAALREDPDIILVGEMRDLETIRLALTAAETGHLVFGTLHTTSASKTINRIIDVFPGNEQPMVRSMLSESLQSVVSQTLLPKPDGGRVAALEVMICNPAIRNLIREDKIAQMYSVIQTGAKLGMTTLDQHLKQLVADKIINKETAQEVATDKTLFI